MSFIQQTESYYTHKREAGGDFQRSESVFDHKFLFDVDDLSYLMSYFQEEASAISILAQMGGVEGISYALRTDMSSGLGKDEIKGEGDVDDEEEEDDDEESDNALAYRQSLYGSNSVTEKPPIPFWSLCYDETKDPMLRVLIVAGVVSIVTGAFQHPKNGWIDGLAILLAVCIVVVVGGFNNFQKEKQFRKQEAASKLKFCIVLRGGEERKIPFGDVVVGDLVVLRDGFTIPADGIFVLGTENLRAQEAGLTGESKELSKNRFHPLLMKGTNIVSGEGLMITVAVGDKTEWGRLMAKLKDERDNTPLQDKLEVLGTQIGWGGMAVAIVLFLILVIYWAVEDRTEADVRIIEYFIIAVTIVVVAVPEGLPLAVTISLAYSMKKMLADNNFVRHLAACETMGNATTICSDKTGTLTTNKMSVSKCHLFGRERYNFVTRQEITTKVYDRISVAICVNSTSFEDDVSSKSAAEQRAIRDGKQKIPLTGGNQTDCAILQWVIDLGATNYKQIREQNPVTKFFPFDSKVKRSSVLCKEKKGSDNFVLYVKGAAEEILSLCSEVMNRDGESRSPIDDDIRRDIVDSMGAMTCSGLRCVAVAYGVYRTDEIPFKSLVSYKLDDSDCDSLFCNLIWIGCVGIADPVRREVPDAVATCQRAGIVVRMVTGDHLDTAKHIAKQCGILTCADHVCMTGAEFRLLSDEDKCAVLPRLRVLARSKPADKEELVIWYKTCNTPKDIVAVTGDGANDALALKNADVGLAMGIQGTDVAKEASDVIIMDDNFASIKKTVMWGRSVYDNIRKFVQFQLTVNVTALTISLVGAFYPPWQNPLTAVQLLWVNLIMDTMAALALATEHPTPALLDRHPFKKDSHLITKILWRFIFGHSIYQLTALMLTLTCAQDWLDIQEEEDPRTKRYIRHLTVVFNTFVWMQLFNEINARKVNNERNVLDGIFVNPIFWLIIVISIVAQVILVQFMGEFATTTALNITEWAYCVAWGAGTLIWHQVVLCFPIDLNDGIQLVDSETLFKVEPEFAPDYQIKVDKQSVTNS
eukprot:148336_1